MSEVVVIGAFKINPGKEEEALEAFTSVVGPTHAEDGCLLYALHRSADDPSKLTFIERWASRAYLDAHLAAPHIAAALARGDELWGSNAEITVYESIPAGEATKGSLAGYLVGTSRSISERAAQTTRSRS